MIIKGDPGFSLFPIHKDNVYTLMGGPKQTRTMVGILNAFG